MLSLLIKIGFAVFILSLMLPALSDSPLLATIGAALTVVLVIVGAGRYTIRKQKQQQMRVLLDDVDTAIRMTDWLEADRRINVVLDDRRNNIPGREVFDKERASVFSALSGAKRCRNIYLDIRLVVKEMSELRADNTRTASEQERLYPGLEVKALQAWHEHDKAAANASIAEAQLILTYTCLVTIRPLLADGYAKAAERFLFKIGQGARENSDVHAGTINTLAYFMQQIPCLR